jgi:hypothetical protein
MQRAGESNRETVSEVLLGTMWSFHQHRERLLLEHVYKQLQAYREHMLVLNGAIEKLRDAQEGGASWRLLPATATYREHTMVVKDAIGRLHDAQEGEA